MLRFTKKNIGKDIPDWSFQDEAVRRIVSDFENNSFAKVLLVIPTGGGKTITALKTIHELLKVGLIFDTQKILWVTHRKNLKKQVEEDLEIGDPSELNEEEIKRISKINKVLDIVLITEAKRRLATDSSNLYKLIIIDEAHHAGASGYKELFKENIGILGLTATPTRTDSTKLEFQKISYQITYRELLKRNVILKPEFLTIETNSVITLNNSDNLEDRTLTNKQYNNTERNQAIAKAIFEAKEAHKKVIIFAGSNDHVDSLYEIFRRKNKLEGEQYHIGYIYSDVRNGKTNEQGIDNDQYLKWHKKQANRSILINCGMLTEGYNDPMIDTVVLTVPTKSILYYMQCVGRVVRRPPKNLADNNPKTYVLECEDKYINFVYRIGNEWLFSDISSYLEPVVISQKVGDESDLRVKIIDIMKQHDVEKKYYEIIPKNLNIDSTSLLLFKSTENPSYKIWYPLIFTPTSRAVYTKIYNELSENISQNKDDNPNVLIFDKLEVEEGDPFFGNRNSAYVTNFHHALGLAYADMINGSEVKRIKYYNFFEKKEIRNWLARYLIALYRKVVHRLRIEDNKI